MLTSVVNVSWPFQPVVVGIRDWLYNRLRLIEDELHRDDVLFYLEETDEYLKQGHPYGSCYYVLEALARFRAIDGPDRIEVVGQELCAEFQRVYPTAPTGFERTGRMSQRSGDEAGHFWVEPLRGHFLRHHLHLLRRDQPDL